MVTVLILSIIIFTCWKVSDYYKQLKARQRAEELARVPVDQLREQMEVYVRNENFERSSVSSVTEEELPDYKDFENSSRKLPDYQENFQTVTL